MPKKTFRSNNSNVVIKRNKFGAITRHKVRKRAKFILIDEKNENNWKYLKSELGYKTDSLFLEYLLNLAQRELGLCRPKKRQISNENEETLKTVDCNSGFNNEKQCETAPYKTKSRKSSTIVENEKKREAYPKASENEVVKTQICRDLAGSRAEDGDSEEKEGNGSRSRGKPNSGSGKTKSCKTASSEDESTKHIKTETANDFDLDCISLNSRNKEQNVDELSAFKNLNLYNSSDRNFFSHCENISAIEEMLSPRSDNDLPGASLRKDPAQSKESPKAVKSHSQRKEGAGVRRAKSNAKLPKEGAQGDKAAVAGTEKSCSESDKRKLNREAGTGSKPGPKTKFCTTCNRRHLAARCPAKSSAPGDVDQENEEKQLKTTPTKKNFEGSCNNNDKTPESRNIYDFDESEREINIEGNSRWCHKFMKSKDAAEENDIIHGLPPLGRDEPYGMTNAVPENGEANDSDSSNSGLKLRIDESFGEQLSFAESSLPDHLQLKVFDEEHGQSVFAKTAVARSTHFGPLVGERVREMDIPDDFNMKFIWEVNGPDGVFYLSTKEVATSNWLRFLRPANTRETANLLSSVNENQLYFISTRDINEGEELLYWMNDTNSAWSKKKLEKKNCGGCNIQFSHPFYYRRHCMIFHDPSCSLTIRKYHCKICGLAVLGKEKIMKHAAEMHQGKGAYQCQYCHKFFLRLNYLEMHRTYGCSKNPQRSRPLCDLCGRKFCQPQKLKVHIKRMHSDMAQVLKDFQCKSCLKILGSRAALQRHMKEVHNKDIIGACTCDRCGKMFQNKSNLKIHMLTHSGVKPFKCQQTDCTAAFTTKQCLQFHYKKVHGFTDDFIPKIERSIAYTFDAYSGGTVSEPTRCPSPRFEERVSPVPEQRECGLDLSLVTSPVENSRAGKEKVPVTGVNQSGISCPMEEGKPVQQSSHRYVARDEQSPGHVSVKQEEEMNSKEFNAANQESNTDNGQVNKIMVSKGSKKWIVSDVGNEKNDERFKPIFRPENSNASLLVEAAITAAEKDITEKPIERSPVVSQESIVENPAEIYSINQYVPNSPSAMYESSEKKLDEYGKLSMDSQKADSFAEVDGKKTFPASEKTNFNDFLRCSSLLRINTSPVNEMPKDYNISSIIRDQETESFTDIEIQDYRNRDLLETYKENESFHEQYRTHDLYRSEKLDLYRSAESDLRMSAIDKFEYRDFDISNETYRNLATNLEKYRNADIYRLRSEGYDLGVGYRDLTEERDGEAQNLCLKEKSFQYETLEELARIGRDNPGFECLLVGESAGSAGNQNFGSAAPRGLHGMLSPRSYHPSYEGESVDLSVPRPSYSSSPIYTLDLTPTRVDLPGRHLDFRSHLGLSPHRFPNSRIPGLSNGASQMSPTGYSVYSSPYVAPATRHSPTSQFQPYTSLYY